MKQILHDKISHITALFSFRGESVDVPGVLLMCGMNRGNSEAIRQWKCAILIDGGGYLC
ncbi:hypothetical protein ACJVV1_11220 [Staphylococcus pseudintermedius]|uniref:hypothetical protein n=1 Tax=Staphylococcus pseudintermedius TaxID=283734 RepID=UPI0015F2855F|nr:hypothetical protein [Staphylococcus pseudintermedius]EHD5187069.1 hypothetical protein [Staphylococcus pseudintermedius]ELH8523506.1 hypothetical protein [Staphylococcus pseudintermedius]ELI4078290.1 hypothetical protein [Staphylococcus pseudintermedius]HAR5881654.1 hypothetical protein [Staphylococcus pseudintermedius]HAR5938048.1 hypothetical protein [Staphylococcus pseudintermedius]